MAAGITSIARTKRGQRTHAWDASSRSGLSARTCWTSGTLPLGLYLVQWNAVLTPGPWRSELRCMAEQVSLRRHDTYGCYQVRGSKCSGGRSRPFVGTAGTGESTTHWYSTQLGRTFSGTTRKYRLLVDSADMHEQYASGLMSSDACWISRYRVTDMMGLNVRKMHDCKKKRSRRISCVKILSKLQWPR